jgi:hypothetical protein
VLEETSRGDLRLVEIQVKVEICSVVTCFHKSYRGPPKPLWHLTCADFFFLPHAFCLSFICFSRSCHLPLLVEDTYSAIKKNEGSSF